MAKSTLKKTPGPAPTKTGKPAPQRNRSHQFLMILFVSAWMFILGVLVGRGTAPVHFDIEKLENELAQLREAVLKKEKDRIKAESENSGQKPQFGFYDTLKKTREDHSLPAPSGGKFVSRPAPKHRVPKEVTPPVGKKTLPGPKAPTPREEKAQPKREAPAQTRDKQFTIQIASLKDPRTADAMVEKLRMKGYPAYRVKARLGDRGTWYRIRIGSYGEKKEASPVLEHLAKDNFKPILVKYD
jgi:DedD protein